MKEAISDYELLANEIMYPGKSIEEVRAIQRAKRAKRKTAKFPVGRTEPFTEDDENV